MSEYAAAGDKVEVPALDCPGCGRRLRPWSSYRRRLRGAPRERIWVRRGRCPAPTEKCQRTQALLPEFVVERRLDEVDTIGAAAELAAAGRSAWKSSEELGRPFSTVRDWRHRLRERAPDLLAALAREALLVGVQLGELPTHPLAALVALLREVWERSRARSPGLPELWRFWNLVCSGRGVARNTHPV
ncbi:MAG TPA: hypothetical protein VMV17_11295 [Streptosporangiaceae bacterium]|nr:hypothetical protein [Streptosporangiaceae bacterium]